MSIQVSELERTLSSILTEYSYTENEIVKRCVEQTAKNTVSNLKSLSPVHIGDYPAGSGHRNGDYSKSWNYKKTTDKQWSVAETVYNKKHYRLTHLLEYGHDIVNKQGSRVGRANAKPHIAKAESKAISELTSTLLEELPKGDVK